jgi:biotin-(acetyl-CoA carboxylase) ligase
MSVLTAPAPTLDLPPGYTLVALREVGDAFRHACAVAADAGAGTFVWARRFDLLDVAVVLEPEEPLLSARRAFLIGMAALADAVGVHGFPEKAVSFGWPDTLYYDGARLGGGRLAWPDECTDASTPDWLVFGATLLASKHGAGDPGLTPDSTSLEDEGFEPDAAARIAESFARHLLAAFDTWREDGFSRAAERYLDRLPRQPGERLTIEQNGDVLIRGGEETRRLGLAQCLREPSWLDPSTGSPRL